MSRSCCSCHACCDVFFVVGDFLSLHAWARMASFRYDPYARHSGSLDCACTVLCNVLSKQCMHAPLSTPGYDCHFGNATACPMSCQRSVQQQRPVGRPTAATSLAASPCHRCSYTNKESSGCGRRSPHEKALRFQAPIHRAIREAFVCFIHVMILGF